MKQMRVSVRCVVSWNHKVTAKITPRELIPTTNYTTDIIMPLYIYNYCSVYNFDKNWQYSIYQIPCDKCIIPYIDQFQRNQQCFLLIYLTQLLFVFIYTSDVSLVLNDVIFHLL